MNIHSRGIDHNSMTRALSVIGGVTVNVLLNGMVYRLGVPLYLDMIGTIGVAFVGGLFPGIMAALVTNFFCSVFNHYAIYYSILSVAIAICATWFAQKKLLRKTQGIVAFICCAALISGGGGALIQWALLGGAQFAAVEQAARAMGGHRLLALLAVNIALNFVDKAISTLVAVGVTNQIPADKRRAIWNSGWRQKPLSDEDIRKLRMVKKKGRSVQTRMTMMLTMAAVTLTAMCVGISLVFYARNTREEHLRVATGAAQQVVDAVSARMIDTYISQGEEAPGYAETKRRLQSIRDNTPDLEHIYVLKMLPNGSRIVFDVVPPGMTPDAPGETAALGRALEPYRAALLAGEEIGPVESGSNTLGWIVSVCRPIRDINGHCAAYACADVSINLNVHVRQYLMKVMLIFSGIFVLVLAYGLWVSQIYLVYPINSLAACAEGLVDITAGQKELEENVKRLRALDIHTGDEVEKLYQTICTMTMNTAVQMRDIRHFAEVNEKMQNGLIITMADMVENRDSDTGAHIQKTSAYVKIILNALKEKGYYAEKLTARYMSDVVISAPLHDVGKISIPDAVLNKPGKLTEEEFEIMKTHTTAGKEIMERAISTVEGENYLKEARNMAAYHHERWDGTGYPEGLHGEVIPLSARVMAVADVFDALTSERVYKPPFSLEKAVEMIREGSGKQFDPKCVEAFADSLPAVKAIYKKYRGA